MAGRRAKIALLVLLSAALTAACPRHEHSLGNNKGKRWYSLRFWPWSTEDMAAAGLTTPWPKDSTDPTGMTTIRYCYNTINDYYRLTDMVVAALDMWKPAFAVSSLQVLAHMQPQTCNDQTRADVLRIYATNDGKCVATVGYGGQGHSIECDPNIGDTPEERAMSLAHEFGHVFGLMHEHERPDKAAHVDFRCQNLWDYDLHVRTIADRTAPYANGDTIEKVCNDLATATRYKALSIDFIVRRWANDYVVGAPRRSKTFDHDSIMIYSSFCGSGLGHSFSDLSKAVLVRREQTYGIVFEIFQGGSRRDPASGALDFSSVRISEGDIVRIAQLYPLAAGEADVAKKPEWESVPN